MKNEPLVFILVPVHNRLEDTIICINSLKNSSYLNSVITIVDDGSTDETNDFIKRNYPDIHILKGDGTLWWPGAINLGIKHAIQQKAKYVLLLNNDCLIQERLIEHLVNHAEADKQSIIGALVFDVDNPSKIVFAGKIESWLFEAFKKIKYKDLEVCRQNNLIETDVLYGKGTLIRCELLKEIGIFDCEVFPHYHSDIDFSLRAKASGIKLYIGCNCKVWDNRNRTLNFLSSKTYFSKKSSYNINATFTLYRLYCKRRPFILFLLLSYIYRFLKYLYLLLKKS